MTKAAEDHHGDPFLALLEWRNTPSENLQLSPAQIIFGRRTRTTLPTTSTLLQTPTSQQTASRLSHAKQQQAAYYDRTARARPQLSVGQTVRFKSSSDADDWKKGEIVNKLPYRSYSIRLPDGTTRRRTSKHVRFSSEPPIVLDDSLCSPKPVSHPPPDDRSDNSAGATQPAVHRRPPTTLRRQPSSSGQLGQAKPPPVVTRSGRRIIRPARYR